MKKKVVSLFAAIALLASVCAGISISVNAEETVSDKHIHTICNNAHCEEGHENIEWTPWRVSDSLPTETGNYYLDTEVTLINAVTLENAQINLCLNGHIINQMGDGIRTCIVEKNAVLNLCDCGDTERIFYSPKGEIWTYEPNLDRHDITPGGSLNIEIGGVITCTSEDTEGSAHGGFFVRGKMNMYGGNIVGCGAYDGGAVEVDVDGEFTMYDGNIDGCVATLGGGISNNGVTNMLGGSIYACTAAIGGGIDNDGTFIMTDGWISHCRTTYGGGGGVSTTFGDMTMSGGSITDCYAPYPGGGVYCGFDGQFLQFRPTITFSGDVQIFDNTGSNYNGADKRVDNLYISHDDNIVIGELAKNAYIGITVDTAEKYFNIGNANKADYSKNFHSDKKNYTLKDNAEGDSHTVQIVRADITTDKDRLSAQLNPEFADGASYQWYRAKKVESKGVIDPESINDYDEENDCYVSEDWVTRSYIGFGMYDLEAGQVITFELSQKPDDEVELTGVDYTTDESGTKYTCTVTPLGEEMYVYAQIHNSTPFTMKNLQCSDIYIPDGEPLEGQNNSKLDTKKLRSGEYICIATTKSGASVKSEPIKYERLNYPYQITDLRITNTAGEEIIKPSENQSFIVEADIVKTEERSEKDYFFVAVYDTNGALMSLDYAKAKFTVDGDCSFGFNIPAQERKIGSVKAFVWNTFNSAEPLAETKTLSLTE